MAYTAKTTGHYIGQFTMFDPVAYNKLLNEGCSFDEARKRLKNTGVVVGSAFYPFYSYTVNGVEYVRASYRLHEHFGRSIGSANMWMTGKACTVLFDPANPGDAVVEDKKGAAEAGSVTPGAPKKAALKWIFIIIGAFVALGLVQIILHFITFMGR